METNGLKNIWKKVNPEIRLKSTEELDLLLKKKSRKTFGKYIGIISLDITVGLGLIVFLIATAMNRQDDIIYLAINSAIGLITITITIYAVIALWRMNREGRELPLKKWLELKISMVSDWLYGKYSKAGMVLIPILCLLLMLSIHVYYEHKTFLEVIRTNESIMGFAVGYPFGLLAAFFTYYKVRRYQKKNLDVLKEMHKQLCD